MAVQDLGLVLVPGGGGAVGVQDQGPAPAMDDHLMMEPAQQHAVLGAGRAAVGLVLGVARSSTRRHRACSSAVIAVASAAARWPIAAVSISNASSALAGDITLLIAACHLLPMLANRRPDSSPRAAPARARLVIDYVDPSIGQGHSPVVTRQSDRFNRKR